MKISISGCAGIGKSTIAARLAHTLGIPLIPEHYDALFQSPDVFNGPPEKLAPQFDKVLEGKRRREQAAESFVTDRCPIDLFNFWLARGLSDLPDATREFAVKCRSYARDYDLVVIPPWGVLPMKQVHQPEERRRRILNPWVQFRNHATILGLAQLWLSGPRILVLPAVAESPEQRVQRIIAAIHDSRGTKA